ncbi:MAG: cell envelope integrity protein TolA [Paludibacteraceae bacterium]|nr:cell envelope integrity protein TolA [Paludibacteraceae bacterium]
MEDFIEIIFYVVILALSGIGSLLKNKKKQQQTQAPTTIFTENQYAPDVFDEVKEQTEVHSTQEPNVEENELIRMLREAAAAAEAQQREKEALEQQQKALQEEQVRRKIEEENVRKAETIRAQRAAERAKQQAEPQKIESEVVEGENSSVFGLNLSDVDEARRAFVASEIFNKKYC